MKLSWIVPAIALAAMATVSAAGCEEKEKVLAAEGGACDTTLECQPGLSCVATGVDSRVCRTASVEAPPLDATIPLDAAPDATLDPDSDVDDGAPASDTGSETDASDAAPRDARDRG
jgi:hypothetical protein